eukprot:PhM_4_TR18425/c3_g1_i1/m.85297
MRQALIGAHTLRCIALEALVQEVHKVAWHAVLRDVVRPPRAARDLAHNRHRRLHRRPRCLPCGHLRYRAPRGPNVRLHWVVPRLFSDNLRGHPERRPRERLGLRNRPRDLGLVEVSELRDACVHRDEDVVALDVAMRNVLAVKVFQAFEHVTRVHLHNGDGELVVGERLHDRRERAAGDELKEDEQRGARAGGLLDGAEVPYDVGVGQVLVHLHLLVDFVRRGAFRDLELLHANVLAIGEEADVDSAEGTRAELLAQGDALEESRVKNFSGRHKKRRELKREWVGGGSRFMKIPFFMCFPIKYRNCN